MIHCRAHVPVMLGLLLLALGSRAGEPAGLSVQPRSQTVVAGCEARFSAEFTGNSPAFFQWYRDGQPIPGKVNPTLRIPSVRLEDNGARFLLTVTNELGGAVSDEAILTVIPDDTAPLLREVAGDASRWRVFVRFGGGACGEPRLDRASAEDVAHYSLRTARGTMFTIYDAALDEAGTLVTLVTDYQFEDVEYALAVRGVRDVSGHVVAPDTSMNFRAQWPVPGTVLIERFRSSGENCAGPCPIFPCGTNLMSRSYTHSFDSELGPAGSPHEAHCVRMSGYFVAPISGRWSFYLRSAEPAKLYAAPVSSFGLEGIAGAFGELISSATCCQPFGANASEPIYLAANQLCYLEGLARESEGPGYLQVAAKLEGDPVSADQLAPIPAEYLRLSPGASGVIGVFSSPTDALALFGSAATFAVRAVVNPINQYAYLPALYFQWQRSDGYFSDEWEDVLGATNDAYTLPTLSDCHSHPPARYRCRLFAAGASVSTAPAKLIVFADGPEPPSVAEVVSGPTLDTVTVTYSDFVDRMTAGDLFNYSVAGLTVEFAEVLSNTKVRLKTARQNPDQVYALVVTGVTSGECGPEIFPNSTRFQAWHPIRGAARREVYFGIPGWATEDLRHHPKFPGAPDRTDFVSELDAGTGGAGGDLADDYGLRLTGYLQPSVSQLYDFFLSADEFAEFRLSTDEGSDGFRLVCQNSAPNGWRQWGFAEVSQPPPFRWSRALYPSGIALEAGRQYAFEALLKERAGTDHLSVAWTRAGDPVPGDGTPPIDGSVLVTYDRVLEIIRTGDSLMLSWTMGGYLQSASSPEGPWTSLADVPPTANSLVVPAAGGSQYYRVQYPTR